MKTIKNLLLCMCVVMMTPACGGLISDEGKDSTQEVVLLEDSMTVREFYQRMDGVMVNSICHRAFVCPEKDPFYTWLFSSTGSKEACVENMSGFAASEGDILTAEASVRGGRLSFNAGLAESCLETVERELRAAQCSFNFEAALDKVDSVGACDQVIKGNQLTGDFCASSDECGEGYCEAGAQYVCGGVCQRYAKAGEGCGPDSAACGAGLSCLIDSSDNTGSCVGVSSRKNGASCSEDDQCSRSSWCIGGKCETATDAELYQPGEWCNATTYESCKPGYVCGEVNEYGYGTCMAPLPQGSSCLFPFDCAGGLTCRTGNAGATCQPKSKLGQACAIDWDCDEGYCGSGMCKKYSACDLN